MKTFTSILWALVLVLGLFSCKKSQVSIDPESLVQPAPLPGQDPDSLPESYPAVLIPVSASVNVTVDGFYAGLPALYQYTTKKYPLLISLPGVDAMGDGKADLSKVLRWGIPKLLNEKKFPVSFRVGQKAYSFIVISPQFKLKPSAKDINSLISYVTNHYRVDDSRIYVTGHSSGGGTALDYAVDYAAKIAAVIPISTSYSTINETRAAMIAKYNLPIWAFHNQNDGTVSVDKTIQFVETIDHYNPNPLPRKTIFPVAGHDAWTKATDPSFKESGQNIYEWMLQYSR